MPRVVWTSDRDTSDLRCVRIDSRLDHDRLGGKHLRRLFTALSSPVEGAFTDAGSAEQRRDRQADNQDLDVKTGAAMINAETRLNVINLSKPMAAILPI